MFQLDVSARVHCFSNANPYSYTRAQKSRALGWGGLIVESHSPPQGEAAFLPHPPPMRFQTARTSFLGCWVNFSRCVARHAPSCASPRAPPSKSQCQLMNGTSGTSRMVIRLVIRKARCLESAHRSCVHSGESQPRATGCLRQASRSQHLRQRHEQLLRRRMRK